MPGPTKYKVALAGIVRYAGEIGRTYISRIEATFFDVENRATSPRNPEPFFPGLLTGTLAYAIIHKSTIQKKERAGKGYV